MALTVQEKLAAYQAFSQQISTNREEISGVVKDDVKQAVADIDDWVDANAAAFNTAISQPARGALTTEQKAALLMYVVIKRVGG